MGESMLPGLEDFGIYKPGYIRKLNNQNHWYPEGYETIEEIAEAIAQKLFTNSEQIYSLWLVETAEQFYGVVAALSAGRTPKNQNLDFLWIDAEELASASVELQPIPEGQCLYVCHLHFNARIASASAKKLCLILKQAGRLSQRCKKQPHTTPILNYQAEKGCRATETSREHCDCEAVNL
jgi:hypothetical protein